MIYVYTISYLSVHKGLLVKITINKVFFLENVTCIILVNSVDLDEMLL